VKTAALTGILAALALASATSGGEAARPEPVVVVDGACTVCRFFDYAGFGTVAPAAPVDRCVSALHGSVALACSGWSYWDRTRVWKASGGWIRVGFWDHSNGGLPAMRYRVYGSGWNGQVITVDRYDTGAGPYNVSTCAYDFSYGGAASSVLCEAIDW
jgi:hypothetical protein